jgi:hypothetical protein
MRPVKSLRPTVAVAYALSALLFELGEDEAFEQHSEWSLFRHLLLLGDVGQMRSKARIQGALIERIGQLFHEMDEAD